MNVVKREKHLNKKTQLKHNNELVRKNVSMGIRGASSFLPTFSYNTSNAARPSNNVSRPSNSAPRYQFDNEPSTSKKSSMGPPSGLPKSLKRRIINNSSSTKPESSSSGKARPRILASDSAVADTSQDLRTPRNRPTALRYISSSSRGGYSGTRSTRSTSTSVVEASVILAISEGRGMARGEIGIAAVDLRHPHLVLCQFSDTLLYTHTLTKINYFNPVEIIVPHTFCEGVQPNQLYQLIKDHYPLVNLTTVQRKYFNDDVGRQQIQSLCAPEYSAVYLQVVQKFYALTAAAAVLKYVEHIQCIVYARESLKIEYHSSENTMIIDVSTATQLELVQPLLPSAGPTCCLLGVLGPTYTVGGIRALRAAILQPSCKKDLIENKLDAVQDLIENDSGLMTGLQDVIKNLSDIDKILLLCVESPNQNMDKVGEAQLNQTLLLKTTMDMVPKLIEALEAASSGRLKKIKTDFENPNYKEITDRIRNIIVEDAHLQKGAMGSHQRCFAVKPNINGLLDVARRTYSELIDDMRKIVEQLNEAYNLPIRLNQNVMKGFHIVMPLAPKNGRNFDVNDLPPIFIQAHRSAAIVTMTTEELVILDQQAKESLNEIQKMSNIVISCLLKELRPFMSSLYKLCENVAELDILLALAQASSIGSYIRPSFSNYLAIANSIHPLLEYNSQVMPVRNDISATPEHNFTIITGPNMGGKSIYIKQIALLQIMAQLGCFLPATNAVLRLCDRIFSRIGFNDSVELNASTFVFEMKEMQHILKGLTKSSLVIIDELCRGTCTEEGTSLAWAICEELLMSDAFTFFTTHFMYLTRLQELYYNVVNLHTAVTEEDTEKTQNSQNHEKRLVYQHKMELGTTKIEHYGLALAAKTNLPKDTVHLARELAEVIAEDIKPQEINTPQKNDEELLYKLNAEIRQQYRKNDNVDETVKKLLSKFKEDHPQLVERLRVERSRSNIRTDSSANYSSEQTFRPHKSINDNDRRPYETNKFGSKNTHQNEILHRTPVQNLRPVVFNSSTDSDHDCRTQINNNDNGMIANTDIRGTSSLIDVNITNNNEHFTLVKSSRELLTTFMNVDRNDSMEEIRPQNNDETYISNTPQKNDLAIVNFEISNFTKNKPNDDVNNNIYNFNNSKNDTDINNDGGDDNFNEEIMSVDHDIIPDNDLDEENYDLAEALTQVIEERSVQEALSNKSSDMSNLSIDEELAIETIKEINEELMNENMSIEDIILTPPLNFRD